jgi:SAM-dependent methyltransferase
MVLAARPKTALPFRVLRALEARGPEYVWHKILRRTLGRRPSWKRRLIYGDARKYWTLRGGDDYFREQEGQEARVRRAEWVAARVASYQPESILEVGCGYGRLLCELETLFEIPIIGVDFSSTQLRMAHQFLRDSSRTTLILGRGERLPFPDRSFDMVLTSAVILHNPPSEAETIRAEVLRVARRFAAHCEETDVSYNRYGYDTAAWYRARGITLAESGPVPMDPNQTASQFCVAVLDAVS